MTSIRIRSKLIDGKTQLRILITHPMEHGRNRDKLTHELIPTHFIQELTISRNQKPLINCVMAAGISKDPYFSFMLKGGAVGDNITIAWLDNFGNRDIAEHTVS